MTVNVRRTRRTRRTRRYRILTRTSHAPGRRLVIISEAGRRLYTLLTLVTAAGMIAGALCTSGQLTEVMADRQQGFGAAFFNSFAVLILYIGLCFFGGLSVAGAPMAYLLCFFKGLGTGALCSCIFAEGAGGIFTAAGADIIPFEAMNIALLIFAARENLRMSGLIYKRSFGGVPRTETGDPALLLYLKKFGVILLASVAAAAVDAVISVL